MKRGRFDVCVALGRQRSIQALIFICFLYVVLVTVEMPLVFDYGDRAVASGDFGDGEGVDVDALPRESLLEAAEEGGGKDSVVRKSRSTLRVRVSPPGNLGVKTLKSSVSGHRVVSGLVFDAEIFNSSDTDGLQKTAKSAWEVGVKLWHDIQSGRVKIDAQESKNQNQTKESCPRSISLSGDEFVTRGKILVLPCGLTLGSHITVVGKPRFAHLEGDPKTTLVREGEQVMVSQFILELQGLETVEGEEPPRILHLNPRLRGDWSGRPVIEQNTCYRMHWGRAQRCDGWQSKAVEETVDGQVKCEKWIRDDSDHSEQSKSTWWLSRLVGRTKKVSVDWPFPFAEDQLFVLTLSAGFEGYHLNVDGRHISSFPYRTGFALEEATGLWLSGDVDVHSLFAASLPTSHPSNAQQKHLEMSTRWIAPPISDDPVELFIGVLSAGNHFAERMAVRKSWMQHRLVKSSHVVARFFVALHARKEVNVELKKEAEYFGDIVIVPYMDHYDLVVLKTVAICEHGVRTLSAQNIMKCDDDTFVRVDAVIDEARKLQSRSFYMGNINYRHKSLRRGKWAVTYKVNTYIRCCVSFGLGC
uniref:Galectin domain-containing protein n=1 Tax=Kalanchoe fedtschenkoi TaxID=63787 RepID=A0A7N0VML4_KALFE